MWPTAATTSPNAASTRAWSQGTTSTGIGALSAEICLNELKKSGVHTVLRVGTTGCIDPNFENGDLLIPVACIARDGSSECYIDPEFPSFADPVMVMALAEACERLGFRYGLALEYTAGSFYLGQGRPLGDEPDSYWPSWAKDIMPDIEQQGVKVLEMDTAGQFIIGYLHGHAHRGGPFGGRGAQEQQFCLQQRRGKSLPGCIRGTQNPERVG